VRSVLELNYDTEKREIGILMEQIEKQYFTVGKHLQGLLLSKKQVEGKEIKNIRDYMESQRAYVWETWRASNLIQSILLKNPIPEVTVYRADNKSQYRKTVDGQQRLTTIYLFINNQFKLDMSKTMFPEFKIEEETFKANEALTGKTFSELPELWQDIIKGYQLRITTMNNCTEEDAEKAFVQMNSGAKGLKASEIRKAAMGILTRKFFRSTLDSDWILHALTPLSAKGNAGDEILSQVITLIHTGSAIELSKDNIDKVIYSFRDLGLPAKIKEDITNVSIYLNRTTNKWISDKKKDDEAQGNKRVKNYSTYRYTWLNKTNTTMLMYSAFKALENGISFEQFAEWAFKFFQSPSAKYKQGLQDKVNDLKCVELRINAIDEELSKFYSNKQEVTQEDNQWEQQQRIQTLESDITEPHEALPEQTDELLSESDKEEHQELSEEDKESAKTILAIVNNDYVA
jgi:phage-related protein